MSHTITIRLTEDLKSRRTALSTARRKNQRPTGSFFAERLCAPVKGIADSGFIVAFGNRNDRYHTWAFEVAKAVTEPLLTCEAVLAEVCATRRFPGNGGPAQAHIFQCLLCGLFFFTTIRPP
jgi:hypothetical protein